MSLKDILSDFSWETLVNLPPSDLLALLVLTLVALFLVLVLLGALALTFSGFLRERPSSSREEHPRAAQR
jgi:hypothetical protein